MKMMRIMAIVLTMASVMILFACGSEKNTITLLEEYESYVTDVANDGVLSGDIVTSTEWQTEIIVKENMKDCEVTIFGKDYVGVYQETRGGHISYMIDYYQDVLGREFNFRSDTGELMGFNLITPQFYKTEYYLDDVKEPQKYAEELAKKTARTYVDDIDKYEMVTTSSTLDKERDGKNYSMTTYTVYFNKKISGFESGDSIAIRITSKGNLISMSLGDNGIFSGADFEIDKEALDKSIDLAVTNAYENSSYQLVGFDCGSQKIFVSPDGDVCIRTDVSARVRTKVGGEFATGIMITTKIGKRS